MTERRPTPWFRGPTTSSRRRWRSRAWTRPTRALAAALHRLARLPFSVGATRGESARWFLDDIQHYLYAGDTLLHVAAASYAVDVATALLAAGAQPRARNRRGAEPLHYAADGSPNLTTWHPSRQADIVARLVAAGACPNALDKSGVAPLHRAVRTRCTGAVRALLAAGADPRLPNGTGSTPMDLVVATTGRGGAGTPAARREQAEIARLLTAACQGTR